MFAHPELLVSRLLFVAVMAEAVEIALARSAFADRGLFSRANLAVLTAGVRWHSRVGSTVGAATAVSTVAVVQAVAAVVVMVVGTATATGIAAAVVCLATAGYLRARRQIGGSGAEQLTFIVLVTFALVILAGGSETARQIGDAFVAAQLLLAYLAAGGAKAVSPVWRQGRAMTGIMSTAGYGWAPVATMMRRFPVTDRVMCATVIGWEVGFVAVLFAPMQVVYLILGAGVAFHVGCAVLMGLNRFVWAFCGCYPAVVATCVIVRG